MIVIWGKRVSLSLVLLRIWYLIFLRFLVGIMVFLSLIMLLFGTQTWITTTSDKKKRGRNIAYYGLFFGLGFALGPVMTTFLAVNEALPFLLSAVFSMVVWGSMFFVRNQWPEEEIETNPTS